MHISLNRLSQLFSTHKDLKKKIEAMEKKYDEKFRIVLEAIKQLLEREETPRKKIGVTIKEKQKYYLKSKSQSSNGLVLTPHENVPL